MEPPETWLTIGLHFHFETLLFQFSFKPIYTSAMSARGNVVLASQLRKHLPGESARGCPDQPGHRLLSPGAPRAGGEGLGAGGAEPLARAGLHRGEPTAAVSEKESGHGGG